MTPPLVKITTFSGSIQRAIRNRVMQVCMQMTY